MLASPSPTMEHAAPRVFIPRRIERREPLAVLTHRKRAERLAFLLQIARDLERFAADEEPDRFLRHVHRGLGAMLGADLGFVWRLDRGGATGATYHMTWTPKGEKARARAAVGSLTDQGLRFVQDRKSPGDPHLLFTAVEAGGRPIGLFAFLRPGRRFGRQDAGLASDAAELLGRHLTHRERERLYEIRERIVRKVLLQLRPADILYQVLHGLKRLLRYDHSASVQTFDHSARTLTVRAETIAWTKAKSPRIGAVILLDDDATAFVDKLDRCCSFTDPAHPHPETPAALLHDLSVVSPDAPPAQSLILAPLRRHEELVGILAVRALTPGAFGRTDLQTIDSFLDIITATALHSEFFRQQQDLLFEAERRTALGNLARAISHDLNNAFGVIQPLLETLRRDTESGAITPENLKRDLETLSQYVGSSLRIFQGLLSFSQSSVEGTEALDLGSVVDTVLTLLSRGLRTHGIEIVRDLAPDLPPLQARRQEIEQLLLNLLTNARESMPTGGRLTIRTWCEKDREQPAIRLSITDTGCGIPADRLEKVFEPFFSTKKGGTGLGLDICRSITWEYGGTLWLESEVNKGTTAQLRSPIRLAPRAPISGRGD